MHLTPICVVSDLWNDIKYKHMFSEENLTRLSLTQRDLSLVTNQTTSQFDTQWLTNLSHFQRPTGRCF